MNTVFRGHCRAYPYNSYSIQYSIHDVYIQKEHGVTKLDQLNRNTEISRPGTTNLYENAIYSDSIFQILLPPNLPVAMDASYFRIHADSMTWKHFPHYWSFLREIHQSPMESSHKGPEMWSIMLWDAVAITSRPCDAFHERMTLNFGDCMRAGFPNINQKTWFLLDFPLLLAAWLPSWCT